MGLKNKKRIAVILGARPNFVKAAPLFREAKKHPEFDFTLIHTGQHFDPKMSAVFFEEMGIPKPDIMLSIKGEFHTEKIGRMFNELKIVFKENNFDAVIVFGDVNSTLAGALAAVKNNCKLIHIESGLRSHDRRMPEELNRVVVDHLADILFTTEPSANKNLEKEGIERTDIFYVGNIMIESLEMFKANIESSKILEDLNLIPKKYVLATIHRQENIDEKQSLKNILSLLSDINSKIRVVLPLHPGTKKLIDQYGFKELLDGPMVIDPQGYFEFIKMIKNSSGVITDSGGIQEETTHLNVPCATLRDNTERPITIEFGSNKLFDIRSVAHEDILSHFNNKFSKKTVPLWDDKVSERIFEVFLKAL